MRPLRTTAIAATPDLVRVLDAAAPSASVPGDVVTEIGVRPCQAARRVAPGDFGVALVVLGMFGIVLPGPIPAPVFRSSSWVLSHSAPACWPGRGGRWHVDARSSFTS